jgi:hypothetical protein
VVQGDAIPARGRTAGISSQTALAASILSAKPFTLASGATIPRTCTFFRTGSDKAADLSNA